MQKKLTPEELLAMGQDSETKAAKWVIEKGVEDRKAQDEEDYYTAEGIGKAQKNEGLYKFKIKEEAKKRIVSYDIPKGYLVDCVLTSKGLAFGWRYWSNKVWFMKGMLISGQVLADLQEVDRLINQALDEVGRHEAKDEQSHKTSGGVVLN